MGAGRAAARRKLSATTATPTGLIKVEPPDGAAFVAQQHHAQIASIAQARLMNEGRMTSKANDCIIGMHTRKVASVRTMISETKDLLEVIDRTDERRAALINKLFALNEQLYTCIEKCEQAEDCIINDERKQIVKATSVTAFIDATIASAISPDHALSVTPQSTNKRRRICGVDRSPAALKDDDGHYEDK